MLNRSHCNKEETCGCVIGTDSNCKKPIASNFMAVDKAYFFLVILKRLRILMKRVEKASR